MSISFFSVVKKYVTDTFRLSRCVTNNKTIPSIFMLHKYDWIYLKNDTDEILTLLLFDTSYTQT